MWGLSVEPRIFLPSETWPWTMDDNFLYKTNLIAVHFQMEKKSWSNRDHRLNKFMSPCTNDHRNGWSSSFCNIPSKYFESPVVFRQISVDLNITTKIPSKRFKCFSQESPKKMHGEKEPREIIPTKTSMTWGIPKVSGSCLGSQCGFTTNAGSGDTGTQGTAMEGQWWPGNWGNEIAPCWSHSKL